MTHQLPAWLSLSQSAKHLPIAECKLLILVGVTGVGKSTTVEALSDSGLPFDLLPNRRALTDWLIIPAAQRADGQPIGPVNDRGQRFALTRRYRGLYAGGMGHTLTQLFVQPSGDRWILFDGLRGENEVVHAAEQLPNAQFLILDAPHAVRLQRLLGRGDAFDQISSEGEVDSDLLAVVNQQAQEFLSADEMKWLVQMVESGVVSAENLLTKLKIVSAERANYDPATTITALQAAAPTRAHLYDTNELSPTDIATSLIQTIAN